MELYIDIATPEELEDCFGYPPTAKDISMERELCLKDPDLNYQFFYWLYLARGDEKTAQGYLDKIKDPERRLFTTMVAHECNDASRPTEE